MLVDFYGNQAEGFDRIPHDTPGADAIPGDAWRSDCEYALSPYWRGHVVCEVPEGCDFSQHPPMIAPGFRVIEVVLDTLEDESEL